MFDGFIKVALIWAILIISITIIMFDGDASWLFPIVRPLGL